MSEAGRVCPPRYRYRAEALARAPERVADPLYVVGGLYGNPFALNAVEALADRVAGGGRRAWRRRFARRLAVRPGGARRSGQP